MAAFHDLIAQEADPRQRERLTAKWARATRERKFGLVFEDHLPELLPTTRPSSSRKTTMPACCEAWDEAKRRIVGRLADDAAALKQGGRFDALARPVTHVRPMFPDFVVVRGAGDELSVDILEPNEPSRHDNVAKVRALARFAERHGAHFGRIQLIRKQRAAGGAERFVRLEINSRAAIEQLLLIGTGAQLDPLFDGV